MTKPKPTFVKVWTPERVARVLELAAMFPAGHGDEVARMFNESEGTSFPASAIKFAMWKETGEYPTAFKVPRKGSKLRGTNVPKGEEISVDDSEFDAIPQRTSAPGDPPWNAAMPEGQRLKGNSTRLDGAGKVDQRWVKTERATGADVPVIEAVPPGHLVRGVSTMLDSQGEARVQWVKARKEDQVLWDQFVEATEKHCERYKGLFEPIESPKDRDEDLFTVYPLGDPHIGLLSWHRETGDDFDLHIADQDLTRAIDMLVDRSPASKRAALVNVGDFFHAQDNLQRTPTGGNKLDVDSRIGRVIEVGLSILERMSMRLLEKHEQVDVVNVPGNHDPNMATMIAMWLKKAFSREPRVTVHDANDPFVYLRHGKNLIGVVHGDGAKMEQLPGIMATRRPVDWGETIYRMWITGHIHHKRILELPGCDVESFNTLAGKDYWSHWKGFESRRYLSSLTFHREFGPTHREVVDLRLIRS